MGVGRLLPSLQSQARQVITLLSLFGTIFGCIGFAPVAIAWRRAIGLPQTGTIGPPEGSMTELRIASDTAAGWTLARTGSP